MIADGLLDLLADHMHERFGDHPQNESALNTMFDGDWS
jgi:hypothetical protein